MPMAQGLSPIDAGAVVVGMLLGEGAFGAVHLATVHADGAPSASAAATSLSAMKMIPLEAEGEEEEAISIPKADEEAEAESEDAAGGYLRATRAMFAAEAALLQRLNHANILGPHIRAKSKIGTEHHHGGSNSNDESSSSSDDGGGGVCEDGSLLPVPFVFEHVDPRHGRVGCMLTEHCNAGSLADYTGSAGLAVTDLAGVASQLCKGLAYLHFGCGIMHGDVKQENILVDVRQHANHQLHTCIKLADFGAASAVVVMGGEGKGTATELPRGTICFSPPERFAAFPLEKECSRVHAEPAPPFAAAGLVSVADAARAAGFGVAADLWGLGCMLWEASTGECLPLGTGPRILGRVAHASTRADARPAVRADGPDAALPQHEEAAAAEEEEEEEEVMEEEEEWAEVLDRLTAQMVKAVESNSGNIGMGAGKPAGRTVNRMAGGKAAAVQEAMVALPRLLQLLLLVDPRARPSARDILASTGPNAHLLETTLGQR